MIAALLLAGACRGRAPAATGDRAACMEKDGAACFRAGKRAVERGDDAGGLALLGRGCDAGDGRSCGMIGDVYGLRRERRDEQLRLYQRGCDLGDGGSCYPLGRAYQSGRGVERDAARARALFQKGCGLGDFMSCEELKSAR